MATAWQDAAWHTGAWRSWLTDPGSLTRRLQRACPAFRVSCLRQGHGLPTEDERGRLGLRAKRRALIREVLLLDGDRPLVFAHSVIPLSGLRGPWVALAGLGHRPLGAALFANPRIAREPLECRRLDRRHPLHQRAARALGGAVPTVLWARRSLFKLAGRPILVTEVFLPEVLNLS